VTGLGLSPLSGGKLTSEDLAQDRHPTPAATLPTPSHGPNGGVADSLDEAKAAFRAEWEAHG
jgi:hypothetical protein